MPCALLGAGRPVVVQLDIARFHLKKMQQSEQENCK
jgi:hypothetical protein